MLQILHKARQDFRCHITQEMQSNNGEMTLKSDKGCAEMTLLSGREESICVNTLPQCIEAEK